jgi:hypothetical protein
MNNEEARAAFVQVLLDRVREDRHPSATHMAMLEQNLPPEWTAAYVEVLLEKVANDPHPSLPMLNRIAGLVDGMR